MGAGRVGEGRGGSGRARVEHAALGSGVERAVGRPQEGRELAVDGEGGIERLPPAAGDEDGVGLPADQPQVDDARVLRVHLHDARHGRGRSGRGRRERDRVRGPVRAPVGAAQKCGVAPVGRVAGGVDHARGRARDLDAAEDGGGLVERRAVEGDAAVVRGDDHRVQVTVEENGEHEAFVVGIGEEVPHEDVGGGDGAARLRPGAADVRRARDVERLREHGPVGARLVEIDAGPRERGVRALRDPRLAGIAPGGAVVLGDDQAEVRAQQDPVRRGHGEVDAELVGEGAVGQRARRRNGERDQGESGGGELAGHGVVRSGMRTPPRRHPASRSPRRQDGLALIRRGRAVDATSGRCPARERRSAMPHRRCSRPWRRGR